MVPGAVEATILRVVAASACVVRATDVVEGSSGSFSCFLRPILCIDTGCRRSIGVLFGASQD